MRTHYSTSVVATHNGLDSQQLWKSNILAVNAVKNYIGLEHVVGGTKRFLLFFIYMQTITSYAAPHHATSLPYDNQNQRSKKYQNKNYVRSLQSHMLHTCRHPAWFPVVRSSPFMFYRIHIHSPLPTFLKLCAAFCAPLALQTTVYNFVHIFFVYSTPLNSLLVVLLKGGSQTNWLFGAKSVLCGNRRRKS